jgi:hypothetical protein
VKLIAKELFASQNSRPDWTDTTAIDKSLTAFAIFYMVLPSV